MCEGAWTQVCTAIPAKACYPGTNGRHFGREPPMAAWRWDLLGEANPQLIGPTRSTHAGGGSLP